jgi:hypothetical protein
VTQKFSVLSYMDRGIITVGTRRASLSGLETRRWQEAKVNVFQ